MRKYCVIGNPVGHSKSPQLFERYSGERGYVYGKDVEYLRNEIKKGKKVYFYDNGVRNAVLSNFAPLDFRNDVGALWENLMVSERVKHNAYNGSYAQLYFWRTHDQKEIDLVEIEDGMMRTYEFKWNPKKTPSQPAIFANAYPEASFSAVTPNVLWSFV